MRRGSRRADTSTRNLTWDRLEGWGACGKVMGPEREKLRLCNETNARKMSLTRQEGGKEPGLWSPGYHHLCLLSPQNLWASYRDVLGLRFYISKGAAPAPGGLYVAMGSSWVG